MEKLGARFIWLKDCMINFDTSNAPDILNVKDFISLSANKKENKLLNNFNSKLQKLQKSSNLLPYVKENLQKDILKDFKELERQKIKLDDKTISFIKELSKKQGKSL